MASTQRIWERKKEFAGARRFKQGSGESQQDVRNQSGHVMSSSLVLHYRSRTI